MILCSCINLCALQSHGEFLSNTYIIRTAADLKVFTCSYIYLTYMKMSLGNGLALLNKSYDYLGDILSDLILFFYFETTVEHLLLEFIHGNIYINIIS